MTDDAIGVLNRITVIFETLGENDRGIGISELASRAGLPKSTVSRLLSDLVRRHYLERDGTTIRLGLRLFELGKIAKTPQELRRAALPIMSALRRETGANVELAIRDGCDVVCLAVVGRSSHPATGRIGERTPACASASGRAILTQSSVMETICETAATGATAPHTTLIAAPVFSPSDAIEAAILVAFPTGGADVAGVRSAVEATAAAIELCLRSETHSVPAPEIPS